MKTGYDFAHERQMLRTANKEHQCDHCKETIAKGEKYTWIKISGVADAEFYNEVYHVHSECQRKIDEDAGKVDEVC